MPTRTSSRSSRLRSAGDGCFSPLPDPSEARRPHGHPSDVRTTPAACRTSAHRRDIPRSPGRPVVRSVRSSATPPSTVGVRPWRRPHDSRVVTHPDGGYTYRWAFGDLRRGYRRVTDEGGESDACSYRFGVGGNDLGHRPGDRGDHVLPSEGVVDALQLLKEDHEKVKRMLEELDATTERAEKTRAETFDRLKHDLTIHETIEEEILYPALKEFAKTKDITLEAFEEHHVVDLIVAELEATPVTDETWAAKLTVMKENLEHHIEEEEDEMFKQARQVMDQSELAELGDQMDVRKKQLSEEER